MKDTRIVFDEDQNRLQAIFLSKKFNLEVKELYKHLEEINCPVPENGFKTVKEYHAWEDSLLKLNIMHYSFIENILSKFSIDPKNSAYRVGLVTKIFFKKKKTPLKSPLSWTGDVDKNRRFMDFSIHVLPMTTKRDWIDLWDEVNLALALNNISNKTKNKEKATLERDFAVYELFLNVKDDLARGIKKDVTVKSNSPYYHISYYPEFEALKEKYNRINLEDDLRSIVSKFNKLLAGIQIL